MSNKLNQNQVETYTDRVLKELDRPSAGVVTRNDQPTLNTDISEAILTQPLTSGRVPAKIINKIFHLPLFMFKKSVSNYVYSRLINDEIIKKNLQDISFAQTDSLSKLENLIEQRTYEFMKHNDSLKSELMAEINKDVPPSNVNSVKEKVKKKVVNKEKVESCKKINVGSGSHILEDYINMDHREIKGVDIVGDITEIPLEASSMEEIFASHVVEHFTEKQIVPILQHWFNLLAPGGKIRIIVPDIESMSKDFAAGKISWEQLRLVTLGGQDYSSDYHLNTFSVQYIRDLCSGALPESNFKLIDSGRRNGECLELEVEVSKRT